MPYADRHIVLEFPELGDDIVVTIKNPALMVPEDITPKPIPTNPDGTPKNEAMARKAAFEVLARLIVSWNVYDPRDESATPAPLPVPSTQPEPNDVLNQVPMAIIRRIDKEVEKALSPSP